MENASRFPRFKPIDWYKKSTSAAERGSAFLVPVAGFEPARPCGHGILSPERLPIPPHRRVVYILYHILPAISIIAEKIYDMTFKAGGISGIIKKTFDTEVGFMLCAGRKWPFLILLAAVGAACGLCAASYFAEAAASDMPFAAYLLRVAAMVAAVYLIFFIHTALHEVGHLVFGRLTGYGFISYRVGSLMIMSDGGRLRTARYTVAGTSGQCLLSPPPRREDGGYPYFAYNIGGIAVNLIIAAISFLLSLAVGRNTFFGAALLISALIGVGTALTNGLPFLGIDNDGHNIAVLIRSREARDAFYTQLEVVSRLARGGRLRDVPEEIFGGGDHALTNAITAVVPVFLAERKLDSGDIPGALEALEVLAAKESGLTQSMRGPVICDLIFCRLLTGAGIEGLIDKDQKAYMNVMRTSPQVLRTEYAISKLSDRNGDKAAEIKKKLEASLKAHPYRGEAEGERELIAMIDSAAGTPDAGESK